MIIKADVDVKALPTDTNMLHRYSIHDFMWDDNILIFNHKLASYSLILHNFEIVGRREIRNFALIGYGSAGQDPCLLYKDDTQDEFICVFFKDDRLQDG